MLDKVPPPYVVQPREILLDGHELKRGTLDGRWEGGGVPMSRKLWIVLALGVVVAGMGVVAFETRRASQAQLRGTLAAQAEAGMGSTLDDLVAMAPPVDLARQERAFTWMQVRRGEPSSYSRPLAEDWFLDGGATPPAGDIAWADAQGPEMEVLRTLLREGPLCLSSLGWIRLDLEKVRVMPIGRRQPRMPHLLRLREAHRWLAFEAMCEQDPSPALEDLDRLAEALDAPRVLGRCAGGGRVRAHARPRVCAARVAGEGV